MAADILILSRFCLEKKQPKIRIEPKIQQCHPYIDTEKNSYTCVQRNMYKDVYCSNAARVTKTWKLLNVINRRMDKYIGICSHSKILLLLKINELKLHVPT